MTTTPVHPMDAERATLRARVAVLEAEVERLTRENGLLRAQVTNADEMRLEALDMAEEAQERAYSASGRASRAEGAMRRAEHDARAGTLDGQLARAIRGLR